MGTQIWCARTEDSLNLGDQTLHRWNLRLMPNISYAGCPGLSWMVSAQFTLKMCIALCITKNPYFGGSRSFKVIDVIVLVPMESLSAVLFMISSKYVSICNRFHSVWANSGKITISKKGLPLWCHRSRGISSPFGTKLSHKKLDTLGYHILKTRSLYLTWFESVPGRDRQTRQTDGQNSHS